MSNWRVGKYLRLSSEDRDSWGSLKSESESIGGQRKLIDGYIAKTPAFAAAEVFEFCDDGYTGTNFDRPAIQRMLAAARQGKINCIVVKDLSRFGRNYIDVGDFLEKVLPFLGVRFISVKVKNGKRTTVLQGKYQNSWAPFGYVKSVQERGRLEVDPEAAGVVRHIFALCLEGRGTVAVARTLNGDGVPTKSAYRAVQGDSMRWQHAGEKAIWNAAAVRGILTDRRYIGSVVYGRQQAKGVAAHRNIKATADKLVEVVDCHEPLVSLGDFEKVQAMLGKGRHYGKSDRPLAGKIKCGICGHAMPLNKGKEPYFTCGTKWYDSDYSCGEMQYPQEELFEVLWQALRQQIELRVEQEDLQRVEMEKHAQQREKLEKRLAALQRELAQGKEQMREQFERFAAGALTEADFAAFQQRYKEQAAQQMQEMVAVQGQMAELCEKGKDYKPVYLTIPMKNAIINRNKIEVSLELLDGLIREVRVGLDGAVEIECSFGEN